MERELTLAFVLLSAICKAIMDHAQSGTLPQSWGLFWYEPFAWNYKWKSRPDGSTDVGVEQFHGSSTVFVFLTSGWHLAQFFFLNSIFVSLVLYKPLFQPWIDFFVFSISFRIVFEVTYRILRR